MTPPVWTLLAGAAFCGGALNAIAGGGSFLTFPALVFAGVPPIAANATSAVALCPGYLGSAAGFHAELGSQPRARLAREGLVCALGGTAGALWLLATPARMFSHLVPWLLLFATGLFALGPLLSGARPAAAPSCRRSFAQLAGLFAVSVYGGYFNGGLGILLMALYTLAGIPPIHVANALKNYHSLVLSLLSVAAFALAGVVQWLPALVMMAAAAAGGFLGAKAARWMPGAWVRGMIVATGLIMAFLFFRT